MDETLPLLHEAVSHEPNPPPGCNVINFDPDGDPDNPKEWPASYKRGIVALLFFMAFTVTFTCISVVPVAERIAHDLGDSGKSASILLVTVWELGEAAGPLAIGPLSELFGRYPVFNAANILFIAATVLAALSENTTLFIFARILTGMAVASNVLNPAIIGDIFISEERGTAMSLVMLAPLLGGAVGPAISGYIAENLGWQQAVWMSAVLATICEIAFLLLFRETYPVTILNRRVAQLKQETGDKSIRTVFDGDDKGSSAKLRESVVRPFSVFFDSGVLQVLTVYGSFLFTFFYIMATTLPDILQERYLLSPYTTGIVFASFSIFSVIGVIINNLSLDRIYIRARAAHDGVGQPEYRLPLTFAGALSIPFVVALYGWIAGLYLPLPVLMLCIGLLGLCLMLAWLPLMAYVVDAFHLYAASALTAMIVVRCLMGTFLPLAVPPLVDRLGYGWGFSVFAGVSLLLAPIPVVVFCYGARWRQRSTYTQDE